MNRPTLSTQARHFVPLLLLALLLAASVRAAVLSESGINASDADYHLLASPTSAVLESRTQTVSDKGWVAGAVALNNTQTPDSGFGNSLESLIFNQSVAPASLSPTVGKATGNGALASQASSLTTNMCSPRPPDIISWWRAESNGFDSISGNHAVLAGGVTFSTGKVGQAFHYNATTTTGSVTKNKANLDAGTNAGFTIEGWINAVSVTTSIPIFDWNDPSGNLGAHFWILTPGSLYANFLDSSGGNRIVQSVDNLVPAGSYQHVAVTFDRIAGQAKLYLNGTNVAQTNLGSFLPRTAYDAYIGYRPFGGLGGQKFNGDIDELTLYGRTLSAAEIQAIYLADAAGKCTNEPPIITLHPLSQTNGYGANATLTVAATGSPVLAYQWYFNGTNLPGATGTNLSFTNLSAANAGNYHVIVTNACGAATSAVATLIVRACTAAPPGVVAWWRGEGSTLDWVHTNHGSADGGLAYGVGIIDQAFVFNGIDASVNIPATSALNVGASDGFTLETWINPADLSVARPVFEWNNGSTPPFAGVNFWISSSTTNPGGLYADVVDVAGLSHELVTGPGLLTTGAWHHVALTYSKTSGQAALFHNGLVVTQAVLGSFTPRTSYPLYLGRRVAGAAVATRWIGALDEPAVYNRALSPAEIASLFAAQPGGKCLEIIPTILSLEPQTQNVPVGSNFTITVTATGPQPIYYQWRKAGTNLVGETNAQFTIANAQLSNSGSYSVVASNSFGPALSSNAQVTVFTCFSAPAGIIAWWPGQNDTLDIVGAHTGTLVGSATFAPGRVGAGFAFSNIAQLAIPDSPAFRLTNSLTLESWIFPTAYPLLRPGYIFWRGDSRAGLDPYALTLQPDGTLQMVITDASNNFAQAVSPLPLPVGAWTHVAGVLDGTNGLLQLYTNGVLVAQSNVALRPFADLDTNSQPGLAIGGMGASATNFTFSGLIDEPSIYSRALTALELQGITTAAQLGKCYDNIAPQFLSQPVNRSTNRGANVTFSATALGSPVLTYQWRFNTSPLPGQTNSSLSLSNVQLANSGNYSVLVSNLVGAVTSSNAVLIVTNPVAVVRIANLIVPAAANISVPVLVTANGDENALAFSFLITNNAPLTFTGVTLGSNALGASLLTNYSLLATGRVGVAVVLPTGSSLGLGTQEVARLNFYTTPITNSAVNVAITLTDTPITRELLNSLDMLLPATYTSASVTITNLGFEADVSPRTNVNRRVTLSDWLQIGRFALALDATTNSADLQRADCAPRATRGDGMLSLGDWVQAGRYYTGADPIAAAAGPTVAVAPSGPAGAPGGRTLRLPIATFTAGQNNPLSLQFTALGNENAVSFTLAYNAFTAAFVSVTAGAGAGGATIQLNTNTPGVLGALVGLGIGQTFAPGNNELVRFTFTASPAANGLAPITLNNSLVAIAAADVLANELPVASESGSITLLGPPPMLTIRTAGDHLDLGWPLAALGWQLETATNFPPSNTWTLLNVPPVAVGDRNQVLQPGSNGSGLFRLRKD